jgi:hypothetical protein
MKSWTLHCFERSNRYVSQNLGRSLLQSKLILGFEKILKEVLSNFLNRLMTKRRLHVFPIIDLLDRFDLSLILLPSAQYN